jgi:hypothetical protein
MNTPTYSEIVAILKDQDKQLEDALALLARMDPTIELAIPIEWYEQLANPVRDSMDTNLTWASRA